MEKIVKDSFGEVKIPDNRKWGIQTQRSIDNFSNGIEKIPEEIIKAYALIKKAAAQTNAELGILNNSKSKAISNVCDEIISGKWTSEFPLSVWQTGSGTQTNMNVNEVIASLINEENEDLNIHPNDDINMGQSTNDTFPTAMHIAGVTQIKNKLIPVLHEVEATLKLLENKNKNILKTGRTHLQDATPITFAEEISGWEGMISHSRNLIENSLHSLFKLPLGGTAVGTGLNTNSDFSKKAINKISEWTNLPFEESNNKFHGLSSKDAIVHSHGTLNVLATNALKIANDVKWLASGPRTGLGEIEIPQNEPGSSIMPGKVNPTQAEALSMACVQVMGNNTTITIAGSQGNFELNVYMPVMAYNFIQSVTILSDTLNHFNNKCLVGIEANKIQMSENINQSLMLVTALSPHIGYDNASLIAKKAHDENIPLKESAMKSGLISEEDFDKYINPETMI